MKKVVLQPAGLSLLVKARVQGYTRKDGTFVSEHDDGRAASQANDPKKVAAAGHALRQGIADARKKHEASLAKEGQTVVHKDGTKAKVLKQKHGLQEKDYLVESAKGKHVWGHHEATAHHDEGDKKEGKAPAKKVALKKAKKYHEPGTDLHHPGHNRTGMVSGRDGDHYTVRTTQGKEKWHHDEVEKVRSN